jgi:hypothetical protein
VTSPKPARHAWLELLQSSGPFLTLPVAERVWPTGLPAVPVSTRAGVRNALDTLLASGSTAARAGLAATVFGDALEWGDRLVTGTDLPAALAEPVPEHGVTLRPDFAFYEEEPAEELPEELSDDEPDGDDEVGTAEAPAAPADNPYRLLGMWLPYGTHPLTRTSSGRWTASPSERLAVLLRARDVPLGLVSDGRWWALVWAPRGKPVGVAVWDAGLWSEEPDTLKAFVALLHRRRFLAVAPGDQLPALLSESALAQEEVTTTLGAQVREAVQLLVARLDELDAESNRALLDGVSDDDLYAGVVTTMMRLVFLLFAEERHLLPSDDERYASSYSAGRLVEQLERRAAQGGEQTLEHRTGAWLQLHALTRALHGGVAHEDLRLPAYGGGLFDPDRFGWLEGAGVDDLTVLRMLEAVQYVRLKGERRRLTFRALDVEQIGYVYEGLLELEVRTATEPVLGLRREGKKGLAHLGLADALAAVEALEDWTATTYVGEGKLTPARRTTAARRLAAVVPPTVMVGLHRTLGPDLAARLQPLAGLVRRDERDRPAITLTGGRYVAPSTRRSATGAHYTPRSLAEEVVQHALEPLLYRPGPLETLERAQWVLRPSADITALRVADIAMGSGAFLVAACRFLADRLVEAWVDEGDAEAGRALAERTAQTADAEVSGVLLRARRQIAEHCLYGVDINPLAVEMAKLSLWLVTMDRERPFGFLDDRLVAGDSLLGVSSLAQLEALHLDPVAGRKLRQGQLDYTAGWRTLLQQAADARRRITGRSVLQIRDYEVKARLLAEAQTATEPLTAVADALTGAGLAAASLAKGRRDAVFVQLEQGVWQYEAGSAEALSAHAAAVQAGQPEGKEPRRPLHWPLVFPEVFADTAEPGFDAIVGNPPFLGGKKISGTVGDDYLAWLAAWEGRGARGNTDLAARFLLRADALLGRRGQLGYVTTNTVVEGDTLEVGLLQLERLGWTLRAGTSASPWPSASANLSVVRLWASKATVKAMAQLDGEPVPRLGVDLQPFLREAGRPSRLDENQRVAYQGSNVNGLGFTMTAEERLDLLRQDSRSEKVVHPYVIGADLNRRPDHGASRWIVNFHDWSEERAREYPAAFARVESLVRPIRAKLPDYKQRVREAWWRYEHQAPDLYASISGLDHVLAISLTGNVLLPVRVPTGQVFAHACGVFALDDFASLALLSSSVHQSWAIRYTSTMRTDIRYAPSDVFLTLPRPELTPELEVLGKALDTERRELMLSRALGLTKLYNSVHSPAVSDPEIRRLRELHAEIDLAVRDAYGWTDLKLDIGHHPTKIGTRWTVSPDARFEILDRLLVENHRRAALQG